jgi:hypothetical protein
MKRPYIDDAIDHVSPLGIENSSGKMGELKVSGAYSDKGAESG